MGLQKHKNILKNWYFFVLEWNSLLFAPSVETK
jgi:hypothetical protein